MWGLERDPSVLPKGQSLLVSTWVLPEASPILAEALTREAWALQGASAVQHEWAAVALASEAVVRGSVVVEAPASVVEACVWVAAGDVADRSDPRSAQKIDSGQCS